MKKISLVCHGNIARSQILHHYLELFIREHRLNFEVFSCGIAPSAAYPDEKELLEEVRQELAKRHLIVNVERTILDGNALEELTGSNIILAADESVKTEILSKLPDTFDKDNVYLFYEFIGEGQKDYVDTYDRTLNKQDPERFNACFIELERIASCIVKKLVRTNQDQAKTQMYIPKNLYQR